MKSIAFSVASRFGWVIVVAALLCFSGTLRPISAHGATDPNLSVTITRTNQNLVLGWFGSNAMAYQVESSSTLSGWTNSSLVITGSNAYLFVTNPIAGQSH